MLRESSKTALLNVSGEGSKASLANVFLGSHIVQFVL